MKKLIVIALRSVGVFTLILIDWRIAVGVLLITLADYGDLVIYIKEKI